MSTNDKSPPAAGHDPSLLKRITAAVRGAAPDLSADASKRIAQAVLIDLTQAKVPLPKVARPKPQKVSAREAARVVLLNAGRPMHYREISREAVEQGIVKVRGKHGRAKADPVKTMKTIRSYLCESVQHPGSEFVRVDTGIYDLRDRKKADAAVKKVAARAVA